ATSLQFIGCASNTTSAANTEQYTPGLGEIMTLSAMRHAKLWFAGQAENWQLADYELEELHEGMEDAAKFHPNHKSVSVPIPTLIAATMDKPLAALTASVKAKDLIGFNKNFDAVTEGCNTCHKTSDFGFNVVVRPTFNPFANQAFTPNR
ncbi:MAG: hypothetical protein ABL925_16380, partial [Methylococcales bacterium]